MSESAADAARRAFGVRLRDLRKDARLTARELAAATGMHFTKISRIENGRQNPSEDDIREWAISCGVALQIPELIAAHREVEQMWLEHRRELRAGLPHIQRRGHALYEQTKRLCVYEPLVLPGITRTRGYNTAVFTAVTRVLERPEDEAESAADAREERKKLLTFPSGRNTYSFLIEAAALDNGFGGREVMDEQLLFLLEIIGMPHVSFGIIPPLASRSIWPGPGFYLFDQSLVRSETWTAVLSSKRPDEIEFYTRIFRLLSDLAVYGEQARAQIEAARHRLQHDETS
ncbi:helix-turn-helix domain-containing protein [Actinomadura rudentiformis]|uniref:Helix-turn-helix transcriptional regulator n=1 Tax=Actinomadura rudentiformis TaxID=359158 RepID=A0A6H9YFT5_9ACTN|nr:helix-turn-helix transcriptional regulator [Actinomadura rudentiformis]KAB2344910.1 helix-turn-helix transcriptional regulator [Actinomadura rudentiformis]